MQPIRSWTTWERVIRTSIITVMFTVFCALCFWDRYVAYPKKSVASVAENYPDLKKLPPPDPRVTEDRANSLAVGAAVSDIVKTLGPSPYQDRIKPPGSLSSQEVDRTVYFGETGGIELHHLRDHLVTDAIWKKGEKSEDDLFTQWMMGVVLTPVSAYLLFHWVRVLTTRAELSDAGLKVRGRPLIPFDAITGMDSSNYRRRGWVEISYEQDGRKDTVKLDDYVHKEFPAMIREICTRKGFENPIEALKKAKEAEARNKQGPKIV